ncbi:NUDIX hydrolase [Corynebacterium pseudodiphtheriticum]|uniref:NUDIX domain-containing protein n=1 Tax=Corynebacterium pseudodiphtheriticum TaxID=37637 RepID=UPI0025434494|nr:NUDIX hydrolase [Corynebacterium pseudodiphtheriticum]MDK4277664.1 NUDIX hydrolase [Corynebacterium pseudodiphtheriticum]
MHNEQNQELQQRGEHVFSTLNSELLAQGPIVGLRRDTVSMPGGGEATREILEHFGAAAIVAVDEDNRIAMIHQYRHAFGQRLWEIPAGLLDQAGETAFECAQRELLEETGAQAARWAVLGDIAPSPGISDEATRIFLAQNISTVARDPAEQGASGLGAKIGDSGDEEADMELAWIALDDAVAKVCAGEIMNASAVAGILLAHHHVVTGTQLRSVESPFELRPTALAQRRQASGTVQPGAALTQITETDNHE